MEGSSGSFVSSIGQYRKFANKFQCSQCYTNFVTEVQLKHHMNIHLDHDLKYVQCVGKDSHSHRSHLKVHTRTLQVWKHICFCKNS